MAVVAGSAATCQAGKDVCISGGRSVQVKKSASIVTRHGSGKRKPINAALSTMKKLIKNYTTDIPVERTIAEIQKLLAQNGARGIALEYDGRGNIKDIFFKITVSNKELPFRLPAKPERVYQALWGEKSEWEHTRYGEGWRAQAERIAWRICKTWFEAQITLINLEQAKIEEVFLPYLIMPGNKTLFETMERNQFLLPEKHTAG
jgi:hypothetical protein